MEKKIPSNEKFTKFCYGKSRAICKEKSIEKYQKNCVVVTTNKQCEVVVTYEC